MDDVQILGPRNSPHIKPLKQALSKQYHITDLGPCTQYLGMEIKRDRVNKTVKITQSAYLKKVLARFNMATCSTSPTPMVSGLQLRKETILQANKEQVKHYQSSIGSLMYPMVQTRPDIYFAVIVLSRFNQNPNAKHLTAAKRVLRYLRGTLEYGLTYGHSFTGFSNGHDLTGFTDTDWAADEETRRSVGAYIYVLYGGVISWCSKRQTTIALSSCEAEYMAQTQVSKEAIWLTRLLSELDLGYGLPRAPVVIKADNQGVIALAKDPRFHSRTKHIDIQWHFVRDQVETGAIKFQWVQTSNIAADGLTKALTIEKFKGFIRQIGIS